MSFTRTAYFHLPYCTVTLFSPLYCYYQLTLLPPVMLRSSYLTMRISVAINYLECGLSITGRVRRFSRFSFDSLVIFAELLSLFWQLRHESSPPYVAKKCHIPCMPRQYISLFSSLFPRQLARRTNSRRSPGKTLQAEILQRDVPKKRCYGLKPNELTH